MVDRSYSVTGENSLPPKRTRGDEIYRQLNPEAIEAAQVFVHRVDCSAIRHCTVKGRCRQPWLQRFARDDKLGPAAEDSDGYDQHQRAGS
jgi:protein involved in temperature-dependent protein secretion